MYYRLITEVSNRLALTCMMVRRVRGNAHVSWRGAPSPLESPSHALSALTTPPSLLSHELRSCYVILKSRPIKGKIYTTALSNTFNGELEWRPTEIGKVYMQEGKLKGYRSGEGVWLRWVMGDGGEYATTVPTVPSVPSGLSPQPNPSPPVPTTQSTLLS